MNTGTFQSTKLIDGFSTCFRQWKSAPIHCSKLHGYSLKFKVVFEGQLDERNWIVDFGFMKRSNTEVFVQDNFAEDGDKVRGIIGKHGTMDEWFKNTFDHTVAVAIDDPELQHFLDGAKKGIYQLRIFEAVGCEKFAELVFKTLNDFIHIESGGRVRVSSVECFEHEKNSAIYFEK